MQPYLALITPLTGNGNYPDQGLPQPQPPAGGGPAPSHPIVIPGAPPGSPGSPQHPIYITGNPSHPIYIPGYPDQGLPGGGGARPDHGYVPYPDQGLPGMPGVPTHPWVPPEGETLPPPPDEIVNEYVVAVWNPTKAEWTVTVGGATPK
jgi:hypothetical protein